jgi:hypothetical protein
MPLRSAARDTLISKWRLHSFTLRQGSVSGHFISILWYHTLWVLQMDIFPARITQRLHAFATSGIMKSWRKSRKTPRRADAIKNKRLSSSNKKRD